MPDTASCPLITINGLSLFYLFPQSGAIKPARAENINFHQLVICNIQPHQKHTVPDQSRPDNDCAPFLVAKIQNIFPAAGQNGAGSHTAGKQLKIHFINGMAQPARVILLMAWLSPPESLATMTRPHNAAPSGMLSAPHRLHASYKLVLALKRPGKIK